MFCDFITTHITAAAYGVPPAMNSVTIIIKQIKLAHAPMHFWVFFDISSTAVHCHFLLSLPHTHTHTYRQTVHALFQ